MIVSDLFVLFNNFGDSNLTHNLLDNQDQLMFSEMRRESEGSSVAEELYADVPGNCPPPFFACRVGVVSLANLW